jgi:hypothetical protein
MALVLRIVCLSRGLRQRTGIRVRRRCRHGGLRCALIDANNCAAASRPSGQRRWGHSSWRPSGLRLWLTISTRNGGMSTSFGRLCAGHDGRRTKPHQHTPPSSPGLTGRSSLTSQAAGSPGHAQGLSSGRALRGPVGRGPMMTTKDIALPTTPPDIPTIQLGPPVLHPQGLVPRRLCRNNGANRA